jgi:hypothetical protein
MSPFILGGGVIFALALCALKLNNFSGHGKHLPISV